MSFSRVGSVYDIPLLRERLNLVSLGWAKRGVCIHHTAFPDLKMRPKGLTVQHIRNMAYGYKNNLGWSSGPHLYVDEDQIFGMSPMNKRGVHAVGFNKDTVGIEMLGNYNEEDPEDRRGEQVIDLTAQAVAVILRAMSMEPSPDTVHFHREDPHTSKRCPGTLIEKGEFIAKVREHYFGEDRAPRPRRGVGNFFARLFGWYG